MIIEGIVVSGKQLGRTIGFPTANLEIAPQADIAPNGVYAAFADIDCARHMAMVNIGCHPTLPEGESTVEAHIFGFCGDLYGKKLRLEIVRFLRPERKFDSVNELKRQLNLDKQSALEILKNEIQAKQAKPDAFRIE